jgi:phosphoserine phosphatase
MDFSTFLEKKGLFDPEEFSVLKTLFNSYYQGSINRHDFGVLVVESYYRGLSGQHENEILDESGKYWDHIREEAWFPYTLQLLNIVNTRTKSILVSGSPLEVLETMTKSLGFKEIYASKGVIHSGIYTGQTELEMATSIAKAGFVKNFADSIPVSPATSFAFGDSESDFPLLEFVDPQNAYLLGASPDLKKMIIDKNWNLLSQEKEILDHVNSRFRSLFP